MSDMWPTPFSPEIVRDVPASLLSTYTIALEAWRRGLKVSFLSGRPRRIQVRDSHGQEVYFTASKPSLTKTSALKTARDKHLTATKLSEAGIPAPRSIRIDASNSEPSTLPALAAQIGYPVVLKPVDGGGGAGVVTGIDSDEELMSTFEYLVRELKYSDLVLESHLNGTEEIRVLVIDKEVVAAILRIPANVTGDGIRSIKDLISQKNLERRSNPFLSGGPIKLDREVIAHVQRAGYELKSILPLGTTLKLRGKVNADSGGDTIDVTDELEDYISDMAIAAVNCIPGLFSAGVDVLVDRSTSRLEMGVSILELNPSAQIGVNIYPSSGIGRDVPKTWIDKCFPGSKRSGVEGELGLSFSLREILQVLDSGLAGVVEVAEIPISRLPHRVTLNFETSRIFSPAQVRTIRLEALKLQLSGRIVRSDSGYTLYIASPDPEICNDFVRRISKMLSTSAKGPSSWAGPVRLGFHFDD